MGQQWDQRLILIVEKNLLKCSILLQNHTCFTYSLCVSLSILGTQLLCPSDEGFQWYTTSGKGSASSRPSAGKESSVKPQEKDREGTE